MSNKKWDKDNFKEIKIKLPISDYSKFKQICALRSSTMQFEVEKSVRRIVDSREE